MLRKSLSIVKTVGLFLWDPEKVVLEDPEKQRRNYLLSPWLLFGILALMGVLYRFGFAHLTCWTPKFYGAQHMAVLLGGYFILTWYAQKQKKWRGTILLFGSMTLAFMASPPLAIVSFLTLIPYWLFVRSSINPWIKHLALVILYGIAMSLYSFKLFPGLVFHPVWGLAGLMWAFFIPLRLFWYHYQITRDKFKDVTLKEILTYFFLAPASFILPYMFALPRREEIRAIESPDKNVQKRGTVYIITGLCFYLAYHLIDYSLAQLSQLPGMKFSLIPWVYPFEPVFWAVGSSYIITGMYNRLGANVTLAFRSPLNSSSVLEWWRRWNVHFRDMLVDLFFFPLVMGKRKHPYIRLWVGVFGVFIIGSTLMHWGVKHYFQNSGFVPYWSALFENGVMFLSVGILLHIEQYKLEKRMSLRKEYRKQGKRIPPVKIAPLWIRVASYPVTYFIVFISVVGGYATTLIIEGTYVDRPTAMWKYSNSLIKKGDEQKAQLYKELAVTEFEKKIDGVKDISSPWRIRERHGAYKLAMIYLKFKQIPQLKKVISILGWPSAYTQKNQEIKGYPLLKKRINWELNHLKGLNGIKAVLSGDI
jgi:hypothetical protein